MFEIAISLFATHEYFQQPSSKAEPNVDVIYVSIGQAPVTCLMLLGEQLWCASGNTVAIIHAK